jgi:hypothetical protein
MDSATQNIVRAKQQAKYYKKRTSAAHAFLVIRGLKKSFPNEGVISDKDLPHLISDLSKTKRKTATKVSSTTTIRYSIEGAAKIIAAVMPFSEAFDDVYFVAMTHAAASVGTVCKRVGKEEFEGDIVQRIKQNIRDSIAVIADLSGAKSNVLYEVGFSHGIGKPTIHICSTPLEQLPFDVKTWNTISYSKGRTFALKEKLAQRLKEVLKR